MLFVWGLGIAAATVPVMATAYQGLRPGAIPHASTALTTVQTVGAAFSAALFLSGRHAAQPGAHYGLARC